MTGGYSSKVLWFVSLMRHVSKSHIEACGLIITPLLTLNVICIFTYFSAFQNGSTTTTLPDVQVNTEGNNTTGMIQKEFNSKLDHLLQCKCIIQMCNSFSLLHIYTDTLEFCTIVFRIRINIWCRGCMNIFALTVTGCGVTCFWNTAWILQVQIKLR